MFNNYVTVYICMELIVQNVNDLKHFDGHQIPVISYSVVDHQSTAALYTWTVITQQMYLFIPLLLYNVFLLCNLQHYLKY